MASYHRGMFHANEIENTSERTKRAIAKWRSAEPNVIPVIERAELIMVSPDCYRSVITIEMQIRHADTSKSIFHRFVSQNDYYSTIFSLARERTAEHADPRLN
jgi:hypothetical protein